MHDSAGEANKISGRRGLCLPANLNGQCPFLQVETLLLAVVNVRWVASPGQARPLRHEKGAAGLLTGDEKPNLIDRAAIGLAGSRGHILDLTFPRRRGGSIHEGCGRVAGGASDRIGGGDGSFTCSHLSSPLEPPYSLTGRSPRNGRAGGRIVSSFLNFFCTGLN